MVKAKPKPATKQTVVTQAPKLSVYKSDSKLQKSILYQLSEINSSRSFPVYIMQSFGYKYKNSIIRYESIDADGSEVINAGRLIQDISCTIYLIGSLKENFDFIKKLRDTKNPFTLFTNIDSADLFGVYILESIDGTITDGSDAIMLNVTIVEYKKATLRQRNFTVADTKNMDSMLNFLKNQNQIDKR
jgi:hypothetical protein